MIPHIIHQTWKTKEIPRRFVYLRDTWLAHHPGWEYRLWSDADNRAFLAEHYPSFLSVFDAYRTPICRADAIRYFLLKHFGGLYVDLDFECFAPFDDILQTQSVVLGLEPVSHVRQHQVLHKGLQRVVCNALMASPPQHPFWDHVIQCMVEARDQPGPLDATGPFMLTRAVDSYQGAARVEVTTPDMFYPADVHDCAEGRLFSLENWHLATHGSPAMHHWAGTWWRDSLEVPPLPSAVADMAVVEGGKVIAESTLHARRCPPLSKSSPLVSCLMVTRNRSALAVCAVKGFLAQSYPVRELVILDDGSDRELAQFLQALADPRIRYLHLPDGGSSLGALRNQAVAMSRGSYVCQWDDDDLYDPTRLAMQMTALLAARADACFLSRWVIWWPKQQRLAESNQRVWEGSMLCLKSKMGLYPALRRGEDTPVVDAIVQSGRVVLLDQSRLYVYVVHEGNTFDSAHFESQWQSASRQFTGVEYTRLMQELGKGLDLNGYLLALDAHAAKPAADSESKQPPEALMIAEPPDSKQISLAEPSLTTQKTAPAVRTTGHLAPAPSVLILTPIKNAARFLPGYFDLATRLDYPRDKLSLAFLEGDSDDGTYEHLQEHAHRHRGDFANLDLYRHHFNLRIEGERWAAEKQFARRSVISKCRNRLFKLADRGQEWVLWIDADVIDYPADSLSQLLEAKKPIVVPNCVQTPGGQTFDLNTFKFKPGARGTEWRYLLDGIIQPPRGAGRLYLDELRGQNCVELDSVGGTMLLVDAGLHRQNILFPDYSYRGYLDTEGFAMHARDRGIASWGLPNLEIIHASQ
jgi:Anp1/Glycosyl transferase family 2/Glycosyltransferase sugar-binding region containing DXD motif